MNGIFNAQDIMVSDDPGSQLLAWTSLATPVVEAIPALPNLSRTDKELWIGTLESVNRYGIVYDIETTIFRDRIVEEQTPSEEVGTTPINNSNSGATLNAATRRLKEVAHFVYDVISALYRAFKVGSHGQKSAGPGSSRRRPEIRSHHVTQGKSSPHGDQRSASRQNNWSCRQSLLPRLLRHRPERHQHRRLASRLLGARERHMVVQLGPGPGSGTRETRLGHGWHRGTLHTCNGAPG